MHFHSFEEISCPSSLSINTETVNLKNTLLLCIVELDMGWLALPSQKVHRICIMTELIPFLQLTYEKHLLNYCKR